MDREIAAILEQAWRFLQEGVTGDLPAWSTGVLATATASGFPDARTVAVRSVDASRRVLTFNTDLRSPKLEQLRSCPRAVLVFFDPVRHVQLRARAEVRIYDSGEQVKAAWETLSERARDVYRQHAAPGTPVADPPHPSPELDGRRHLAVVEAKLLELDWLDTGGPAHRRAGFVWRDDVLEASWRVP